MNKRKILIILILAIVMISSINIMAFATITTKTDTAAITITGLEEGVQVYAYRIIYQSYNYTADQPYDPQYIWENEVMNWVYENYPEYVDHITSCVTEEFASDMEDAEKASEFYSNLIAMIKTGDSNLVAVREGLSENDGTSTDSSDDCTSSITFARLPMGIYLFVIENGYRVYSPVTVGLLAEYDEENNEWVLNDETACAKSTAISIEKVIVEDEEEKENSNYSTADTICYKITADIPTYGEESLSKNYMISDELEDGLCLDETSIEIYGIKGESKTFLEDDYYSIEKSSSGFEIDFEYDYIEEYESIMINYNANLNRNSSLVIGGNGNVNVATLSYSNDPYVENSLVTKNSNNVIVYTYGMEVLKSDETTGEALADAKFVLADGDNKGQEMYFVLIDGVYYVADDTEEDVTNTLVTNEKGLIYIYGLDSNSSYYILKETKAPDDYLITRNPINIEIVDDDLDGLLDGDTDGVYSLEVFNTTGFTLPLTGGVGSAIFTIAGILLIIFGVTILVRRRRSIK